MAFDYHEAGFRNEGWITEREQGGLGWLQRERRTFSMIAVSCILAATALTDIAGRTKSFAMMEPVHSLLLKRSGRGVGARARTLTITVCAPLILLPCNRR